MNYEKAYKDALEKARAFYETKSPDCLILVSIFPELGESEDERIRKELIEALKQLDREKTPVDSYPYLEWVSWLEKQSKQKPIEEYDVPDTPIKDSEVVTSRMKYIDDNLKPIAEFVMDYANWDLRKDEWNHPVATVPLFRVLDALVQNGKQYSEEHHMVDNNTKPKFKVGNWITNGEYTWKVIEVKPLDYILQSQDGNVVDDTISHVDGQFHSFTREDAKDGDVLIFDDIIMIFKNIKNNCTANTYILYCDGIFVNDWCDFEDNAQPATKEQRDLLFQKMKEAGYTWDAEKKELTKNMQYE